MLHRFVLPVELRSSLNSQKSKPGQTITARLMQDVPLSPGKKIRAGAKVLGQVVDVKPAQGGQPAAMTLRFDAVNFGHRSVPVTTSLRALASMLEVEDAQIPPTGPDRGTPWAWATRDLIGGEVAYGQGGPVARGTQIVGQALTEGVLAPVEASRSSGCRGEEAGNARPQALWVFSSDACGVYGFAGVTINHAGRRAPEGQITLISQKEKLDIKSGSGLLLRVNSANVQ
jgi:hypothetical protein